MTSEPLKPKFTNLREIERDLRPEARIVALVGPWCTPAEVSLGEVLDALPDDSPWLRELELADEDFGRPLGDALRLLRWCRVLVKMHFPSLYPGDIGEVTKWYFDRAWPVYRQHLREVRHGTR